MPFRRRHAKTWTDAESLSIRPLGIKLQWSLNHNKKILLHTNALENVGCEIVVILSKGEMSKMRHETAA